MSIGSTVEQFVNDQLVARERRARSPRFLGEIRREQAEFSHILDGLGNNALDAAYTIALKTPANLCLNAMKIVWDKKYSGEKYLKDAFKMFFGRDGVAHDTLKVVANAIHLASKGVKIGVRQLLKV